MALYYTGYSDCGSPSELYLYEATRIALSSPAVAGVTIEQFIGTNPTHAYNSASCQPGVQHCVGTVPNGTCGPPLNGSNIPQGGGGCIIRQLFGEFANATRPTVVPSIKTDDVSVTWSNPVLIEAPSAAFPKGPGVPQAFYGFDNTHFFGNGRAPTAGWPSTNGSWQYSSDGGLSWKSPDGFSTADGAAMIPFQHGPTNNMSYRTVGHYHGAPAGAIRHWSTENPREYNILPDGSGFSTSESQGGSGRTHNVTFTGLPARGVNNSFVPLMPGTRNYGIVRAANGRFVMLTDLLWATPPDFHGDPWTQMATVTVNATISLLVDLNPCIEYVTLFTLVCSLRSSHRRTAMRGPTVAWLQTGLTCAPCRVERRNMALVNRI